MSKKESLSNIIESLEETTIDIDRIEALIGLIYYSGLIDELYKDHQFEFISLEAIIESIKFFVNKVNAKNQAAVKALIDLK